MLPHHTAVNIIHHTNPYTNLLCAFYRTIAESICSAFKASSLSAVQK